MIPLFKVFMANSVGNYVVPVLHSGYIGEGSKSREFEIAFGQFIQNENVAVVNSGTSAIVLALRLAGVKEGDIVLSSPITCLLTNMAILSVGAKIRWVDVDPITGNIDVNDAKKKCGRAQAILCTDWGGYPCDVRNLQFGIPVIQDSCHSIGSYYYGKHVGHEADYTCFSFQAIKHLTCGDGGALVCKNPEDVRKAKLMRWAGLDRESGASMRCTQDPPVWGYKMQLNDIAASIGLANIEQLPYNLDKTYHHAYLYNEAFGVKEDNNFLPGYWLYTIMVTNQNEFIKDMAEKGIECSKVHDRNDLKTVFRRFRAGSYLPKVDHFDRYHVCIPVGWWLTDEDVNYIINCVKESKWMQYSTY